MTKRYEPKTVFLAAMALLGFLVLTFLSGGVDAGGKGMDRTVRLTAGKADTVDLGKPVADILVANPSIADVGTLRSNRLYFVGRAVGDTNVLVFDTEGNQLADITVQVRVDQDTLTETMNEFFPDEDIRVRTVNDDIILSGSVSNPSVANQARDLAARFVTVQNQTVVDLMSVEGEQQVMLKVRIVEADRTALREYGIEADYRPTDADTSGVLLDTLAAAGLTAPDPFSSGTIFFDDNGKFGPLSLTLQALEQDGLVNTLAEPNLTAISGETAGFLAGGEFPVPTGRDNDGNVIIEFKQFGVSLNFTPTVLSKDRISLQMSTEISALAEQDGIQLVGVDIPGLSVRRAQTTVELGSGSSIMIAGLIQSDTVNTLNGLPGIMDVPVLGELFKSKSFRREETEVLVIVTPYLVKPFARKEAELVADSAPLRKSGSAMMPTTQKFVDNLKKTYGSKVPSGLEEGPSFGYIVD